MSRTEEKDTRKQVARAAGLISLATSVSRVSGYVRDMVLATFFGASGLTDAFFVAYRVPNLLRNLFAEGSISAAFIPVFTSYLTKEGSEEAKKLFHIVLTFTVLVVSVICVIGIVTAPWIISAIAPGFMDEPDKFSLTVLMTRIMFPFLLLISLASLAMGVHNSLKSFFIPAVASTFFNLSIIFSVAVLDSFFSVALVSAAFGVTLGGALQLVVQIPHLFKQGFYPVPDFEFRYPGLKRILRLIGPTIAGMGVAQINIFVSTFFVSYLPDGSATYLHYGMRLIHLPIGVFGVAMATAVLPSLSEQAAQKDIEAVRSTFSFSLRLLFFLTVPAMFGLIAISEPIVNLLFQRGEFDYRATQGTVQALIFYAVGLWAFVGVRVVASAFYSMQDTQTPVKVAILSVLANIVFSFILMGPLKHGGLALANTIGSVINFSVLFIALRKKLVHVDAKHISLSFIKTTLASLIMGGCGYFLTNSDIWKQSRKIIEKIFFLTGTIGLSIVIYFSIMKLTSSEELDYILKIVKRKRKKV
jgi:putative peptidoglycan lipid II flippase